MTDKQNVLFLSIEDLNDWIEPLRGHPDTITPNLTRLARRSVVFENAYAEAPACSPSRTATLFGQHPWTSGVYVNKHKWHDAYPKGKRRSLVGRLRDAGWQTRGAGKVFHVYPHHFDYADWSVWNDDRIEVFEEPISKARGDWNLGLNTDFGPIPDDALLFDERNTDWMVQQLQPGATGQFWALGIYRPHLPFVVQQRYFDQFPGDVSDPPGLGLNRFNARDFSTQKPLSQAAIALADLAKGLRRALWRSGEYKDYVKAYLASITYADELLGKVLDRMDAAGLWDSTHVVLWSDHGLQLGEKLAFRKFTLWERALRVPLMIAGPDVVADRCDQPVSLTDIAPTLFARLGLPPVGQFEGQDLTPALNGQALPRRHATAVWGTGFDAPEATPRLSMTARSATHRYILYWDGSEELYDHRSDPWEHRNLIFDPGDLSPAEIDAERERHQMMLPEDFADPVR